MNFKNRPLLIAVVIALLLSSCQSFHFTHDEKNSSLPHVATENAQPSAVDIIQKPIEPTYENIWARIRAGYGLPTASNAKIDAQLKFYSNNRAYFSKITQQSEPYLYYVVSELQTNNMPLELSLLPFMESAYNPTASSAGNAGMWQLAQATGKNFGLKKNNWYDGRKDVVASTDAVIRLLKKLNAMFDNDWLLTIAAYNAGEGTIQQAIAKNKRAGKPIDFWSLPLSQTTQGYVPQLLALAKIVANPDQYGYKLYPIADVPYFVKVNLESQISMVDATLNTDLSSTQLKKLNAGYSSWLTDPTGPHMLLVPVADAAAFTLKLDSLPKLPSINYLEYSVRKGDTLDSIAKKYAVSVGGLANINNLKSTGVSAGQKLQIPLSNTTAINDKPDSVPTPNKDTATSATSANTDYYIVKSGDSFWSIAKAQKMSVGELLRLNNLTDKAAIKPGQKLVVRR